MIYKFQSRASGDVIMMGPNGDEVLRLIGKQPAAQGIIPVDAMPTAIAALEQAVAADDHHDRAAEADDREPSGARGGVTLKQRVWPLLEMLKRSAAEKHDIVWGV